MSKQSIISNSHLVVLHGDEMAQVAFDEILNRFVRKKLDIHMHELDLSAKNRLRTNGAIVKEAINLLRTHHIGIKNAGITVNKQQLSDLISELSQEGVTLNPEVLDKLATKSPNGAIRKGIDGNIFREDIPFTNLKRVLPEWKKRDINVLTLADGGMKESQSGQVAKAGELVIELKDEQGAIHELHRRSVKNQEIYLLTSLSLAKVKLWARVFFQQALTHKIPAYMALKDTVMPGYDGVIKETVERIFTVEFADLFKGVGLSYHYGLIDAQAALMVTNPPEKALWGIPDNTVGDKMLAMIEALKELGLDQRGHSIMVSRMSAGGGDQYASYNAPSPMAGTLSLKMEDQLLATYEVKQGDPILFMTNHPDDIKEWMTQTLAHAGQTGQEVYVGLDHKTLPYQQIAAKAVEEAIKTYQQNHKTKIKVTILSNAEQLIKMLTDSPAHACYACLNMDGDIYSDIAAALGGSLATASSTIASVSGMVLLEAPHGTAADLYERYLKTNKKEAYFNPSALIYALASALELIAQQEKISGQSMNQPLLDYAVNLKQALIDTVASGYITADIKGKTTQPAEEKIQDLYGFLEQVEQRLVMI